VVNFAAESHVDRSIKDPNSFVQTNVIGVNNLLTVCRENKADKFVQISTDEVYGSLSFTDRPSRETDLLNPSSPYSASKAAGEMLCMAAYRTFSQKVIITRSSNNYGPYQYPEKVIPLFITRLMNNEKVPLYGNGMNVRDWIHVEDNCRGIKTVLEKGSFGEIYNIGGGNEINNMKLTTMLLDCFDKDFSSVERVTDRLGHDLRYALNCAKIKKLGWKPTMQFETGLRETVEWYKNKFCMAGI
jgi:dTDP-glucose 4,6-dehydratase